MQSLHKTLLAAAIVTGLGLATIAVAGPWGGMGDCPMMGGGPGKGHHGQGNPEQRMARMQKYRAERLELLEARLKLTPDQQSAWNVFQTAQNAHHADKMKLWQNQSAQDTGVTAHFANRIQNMEQQLASMKEMAKATGDFYAVLDPTQKQVMDDFFSRRPNQRMMRGQPTPPPTPPTQ